MSEHEDTNSRPRRSTANYRKNFLQKPSSKSRDIAKEYRECYMLSVESIRTQTIKKNSIKCYIEESIQNSKEKDEIADTDNKKVDDTCQHLSFSQTAACVSLDSKSISTSKSEHARPTQIARRIEAYTEAIELLRPKETPYKLGREKEYDTLYKYLKGCIVNRCPGAAFVSGCSGVGKTCVVIQVLKDLCNCPDLKSKVNTEPIFISCCNKDKGTQLFDEISQRLQPSNRQNSSYKETLGNGGIQDVIDRLTEKFRRREKYTLCLLDEVDLLKSKGQKRSDVPVNKRRKSSNEDVLHSLFVASTDKKSKTIFVAISNSVELVKHMINVEVLQLVFPPYNQEQIKNVLLDRLHPLTVKGIEIFTPVVLNLTVRKIVNSSGDFRLCLDALCRMLSNHIGQLQELQNPDGDAEFTKSERFCSVRIPPDTLCVEKMDYIDQLNDTFTQSTIPTQFLSNFTVSSPHDVGINRPKGAHDLDPIKPCDVSDFNFRKPTPTEVPHEVTTKHALKSIESTSTTLVTPQYSDVDSSFETSSTSQQITPSGWDTPKYFLANSISQCSSSEIKNEMDIDRIQNRLYCSEIDKTDMIDMQNSFISPAECMWQSSFNDISKSQLNCSLPKSNKDISSEHVKMVNSSTTKIVSESTLNGELFQQNSALKFPCTSLSENYSCSQLGKFQNRNAPLRSISEFNTFSDYDSTPSTKRLALRSRTSDSGKVLGTIFNDRETLRITRRSQENCNHYAECESDTNTLTPNEDDENRRISSHLYELGVGDVTSTMSNISTNEQQLLLQRVQTLPLTQQFYLLATCKAARATCTSDENSDAYCNRRDAIEVKVDDIVLCYRTFCKQLRHSSIAGDCISASSFREAVEVFADIGLCEPACTAPSKPFRRPNSFAKSSYRRLSTSPNTFENPQILRILMPPSLVMAAITKLTPVLMNVDFEKHFNAGMEL